MTKSCVIPFSLFFREVNLISLFEYSILNPSVHRLIGPVPYGIGSGRFIMDGDARYPIRISVLPPLLEDRAELTFGMRYSDLVGIRVQSVSKGGKIHAMQ